MANDKTVINLVAPTEDLSGAQTIKLKQSDGSIVTFSRDDAASERLQLRAPAISVEGATLTIVNPAANGAFVAGYAIYIDGIRTYYTTNTTFQLTKSKEVKHVAVKAQGPFFADSPFSNLVTYGGRTSVKKKKATAAAQTSTPVAGRSITMRSIIAGDGATPGLEDVSVLNSMAHVQPYEGVSTVYLRHTDADTYAAFKTVESDRNVTLNSLNQTFSPTGAYGGIQSITVTAVNAAIDPNIQSQNIAEGVTILGVSGSVPRVTVQTDRSVELGTTLPTPITPSSGYTAMSQVVLTRGSTVIAGNIREGVDILGITGTYAGPSYSLWQGGSY